MKQKIRIGNSGGFWGDDLTAFKRQLEHGKLDYLTMDFLAEITMSILRKQQLRNPELGYVTDFVDQIIENAELIRDKGVRIISNAGGMNPVGCAAKIISELNKKNTSFKIAVIEGDNIVDQLTEIYPDQSKLTNMETGQDFHEIHDKVQSANAYLGLPPLLQALKLGADIVIAGRVTDTSITMAPMVHEFEWKLNDWDKLASGLVAGHIIECGAQSTGGNFTDWHLVDRWDQFGYPIAEVYPDGSFFIEKTPDSGGLVSIDTVKEQLVYEMGNPAAYISPDVIADFRTIQLEAAGPNRVKVFGVKGFPSTPYLKVSMAFRDGYSAFGSIIISGPGALSKAKKFDQIFWQRLGISFSKQNTEYVGYNACHLNLAQQNEPDEILLRFNVYDENREKLIEFSKNIAPLILSGPPGVAVTGGRPRVINVMTYWPALIRKELIHTSVSLLNENGFVYHTNTLDSLLGFESSSVPAEEIAEVEEIATPSLLAMTAGTKVKFSAICLARSGDKGDTSNIGVIARNEQIYAYLKKHLTAGDIKYLFAQHCKGAVSKYSLDNLNAFNFLLEASLDGGGTKSLMIDAQGKTFAQAFLNQDVYIPTELLID
jgi:hypothetical protein